MSEKKEPVIDPVSGVNLSDKSRKIYFEDGEEIVGGDVEIIKDLEEELGFMVDKVLFDSTLIKTLLSQTPTLIHLNKEHQVLGFTADVDKFYVKKVPDALCRFNHLEVLALSSEYGKSRKFLVTKELFKLSGLKYLEFHTVELEILPSEIGQLEQLQTLILVDNFLSKLPSEISNLKNLTVLDLDGNPLESPPIEIAEQGIDAIRTYFEELEKAGETQYLFESKLLIIGDGGAGKTTFKRKIKDADATLPDDSETTRGIDVDTWVFECEHEREGKSHNVDFRVNLWDFGGQKIYRGTHQMFFSEKSYYVLLADTREEGCNYSYWLNTVEQLAGEESSVLILINEKHDHKVVFDKKGYMGRFGNIIKGVRSLDLSKDKTKISKLQEQVMLHLKDLPGIGDALPPSWVEIREQIAVEKESADFISFDRFKQICKDRDIEDSTVVKTLSGYYTRIGVFTHYFDDPLLRERIYLNSNWLLDTVYKVLEAERAIEKSGQLDREDIKTIWSEIDFEVDYELERLAKLMHIFGLMYQVEDTGNYVVPAHLPSEQPYDEWPHSGEILHFVYRFDKYMPPGMMSRLIVALHDYIEKQSLVWLSGVNLKRGDTYAEITESLGAENAFKIKVVGGEMLEMLAIIREQFAQVLKPFKNLNYEQLVPCICEPCRRDAVPYFHEYNKLVHFRNKGSGAQCGRSTQIVDVNALLSITEYKRDSLSVEENSRKARPQVHEQEVKNDTSKAGNTKPSKDLKEIELFLASSSELEADRRAVEVWTNRENQDLIKKGYFLKTVLWEHFNDAMGEEGLQEEYNKAVASCDIFVSLFSTKVGKYTRKEFEVAYQGFKEKGKPRFVYTYFKETSVDMLSMKPGAMQDFFAFKARLDELKHFPTRYTDANDLTRQLKIQLDKILKEL